MRPSAATSKTLARRLARVLLVWGLGVACAVEPIPTPEVNPDQLVVAPLRKADKVATVIGRAGAAPAAAELVLQNVPRALQNTALADAEGRFVVSVAAIQGERLRLFVAGAAAAAAELGAPVFDPDANPPPPGGADGLIAASVPVNGQTTVTGAAGAVAAADLVLVTNVQQGAVRETSAEADGGFSLTLPAAGGDRLRLVVLRAGAASPATEIVVPRQASAPTDADGDGFTADVDCDDADAASHPAAPEIPGDDRDNDCDGQVDEAAPDAETCGDGLDNDQDGLIDEGCNGGPCTSDADCLDACAACGAGLCVIPPCRVCGADAECLAGEVCVVSADGCCSSCEPAEPNPEICGDGLDNDQDGLVDEGCSGGPCTSDADCLEACAACVDGLCVIPPCRTCASDADCPQDYACVETAGGCCSSCELVPST